MASMITSVLCYLFIEGLLSTALDEPIRWELTDGGDYEMSIDYCSLIILDADESTELLNMQAHCFCKYDSSTSTSSECSSPGPTLVVHPGTAFTITFYNLLDGDENTEDLLSNEYRDLDIVNIHTHGLHISPEEDNVFLKILPGSSNEYTWTIPDNHYPGTHWYHPHHV